MAENEGVVQEEVFALSRSPSSAPSLSTSASWQQPPIPPLAASRAGSFRPADSYRVYDYTVRPKSGHFRAWP